MDWTAHHRTKGQGFPRFFRRSGPFPSLSAKGPSSGPVLRRNTSSFVEFDPDKEPATGRTVRRIGVIGTLHRVGDRHNQLNWCCSVV